MQSDKPGFEPWLSLKDPAALVTLPSPQGLFPAGGLAVGVSPPWGSHLPLCRLTTPLVQRIDSGSWISGQGSLLQAPLPPAVGREEMMASGPGLYVQREGHKQAAQICQPALQRAVKENRRPRAYCLAEAVRRARAGSFASTKHCHVPSAGHFTYLCHL